MDQRALWKLTYGLYLLTAQQDGRDNGCIINTAVQVAENPARVSISVIRGGLTHDMVLATGRFSLTALSVDAPFGLYQHFGMQSGRTADKFAMRTDVVRGANGLVHLTENACGHLECSVLQTVDLGTHTLFIAEVTEGSVLSDRPACTYAYYQSDVKRKPQPLQKKGWICSVCGFVYEGDEPPEKCPVCKVPAEKFIQQSADRTWAAEHIVGVAQGAPEEILAGLRANFEGECSEVGMYLAMARVAHREGYPEIGEYWHKAGLEEAGHAAMFAELLGEVVTDTTRRNLELRVEAEFGATAGKVELADLARAHGLDAIADTVMEMAKDEARHGKALKGLLERHFGK